MLWSPPVHRQLWVSLLLPWIPCLLGKCISDEMQRTISVVSQATNLHKPLQGSFPRNQAQATQKLSFTAPVTRDWFPTVQDPHRSQSSPLRSVIFQRTKRMSRVVSQSKRQPQPIRIKMWIPKENPALSHEERARLEVSVREAVGTISDLLSVKQMSRRLLLSRDINKYCSFIWRNISSANYNKCGRANENYQTERCLDVIIPEEHLSGCAVYPHPTAPIKRVLRSEGEGLADTDFLLYLHTENTDKCRAEASVLAYAVHCQTDAHGRPLAGVVVICRERLSTQGYNHRRIVLTVIHELLHALGFSKELFSQWTGCAARSHPRGRCWSGGQVANTDEMGQMRIYSQAVVRALQDHLNSSHADVGAPLENLVLGSKFSYDLQDAGPDGLSSHWESRVLQGSIMAAVLSDPSVVRIDPITLAALHDTGWYSVNLSRAQSLVWGRGEGALFGSASTCRSSSSFFCTGSGLGCHYLHLHKGECQSDESLEGCRIYKPQSECWKEENVRGSEEEERRGEILLPDSRCFFSSLSKENFPHGDVVEGGCYRHRCTGINRYQIQVAGSDWLDCQAGGAIEVPGYHGVVYCPDKRLCYFHDVAPPVTNLFLIQSSSSPSDASSNDSNGSGSQQHGTSPSDLTFDPSCHSSIGQRSTVAVSTVLGVIPALCVLTAVMVVCKKQSSLRRRVWAVAGAPTQPA